MNYTITLTETENAALEYAAFSPDDWIQNAVHERCRIAIDEIVQLTVQKCLETSTPIPNTKEEIVALAFEQEWVKAAADRQEESELNLGTGALTED